MYSKSTSDEDLINPGGHARIWNSKYARDTIVKSLFGSLLEKNISWILGKDTFREFVTFTIYES